MTDYDHAITALAALMALTHPEAKFLAVDKNGWIHWSTHQPEVIGDELEMFDGGRFLLDGKPFPQCPEGHLFSVRVISEVLAAQPLEKARNILFAYTDNEATRDPWWAITAPDSIGREVLLAGPWFSREAADTHFKIKRHRYTRRARVYCFAGTDSIHYAELREVLGPARSMERGKGRKA